MWIIAHPLSISQEYGHDRREKCMVSNCANCVCPFTILALSLAWLARLLGQNRRIHIYMTTPKLVLKTVIYSLLSSGSANFPLSLQFWTLILLNLLALASHFPSFTPLPFPPPPWTPPCRVSSVFSVWALVLIAIIPWPWKMDTRPSYGLCQDFHFWSRAT